MNAMTSCVDMVCEDAQPRERHRHHGWYFGNGSYEADRTFSDDALMVVGVLAGAPSGVAFVGQPITKATVHAETEKQKLVTLIAKFAAFGLSWSSDNTCRITMDTATAACRLIESLGQNQVLPKIAPDGDGNLVLLWEGASPLLITIDGWKLHVVFAATTPQATYLENVPFDGIALADLLSAAIPRH